MALLPSLPFTFTDMASGFRRIAEAVNALIKQVTGFNGGTNANVTNFGAGYIAYGGLNNSLQGNVNLEFGTALPNPSGVNGNCLLLGSGFGPGGTPNPSQFWIITDQAFDNATPGNTLGITSGETQGAGTANGGLLTLIGGASFGGVGGALNLQGGTSANGAGGATTVAGGNNTNNNGAAGDLFLIGGQTGNAGANVHLIATLLGGVAGDVRIRINSTILIQFLQHGEIFLTASGTGAGLAGQALVSGGVGAAAKWLTGFTGTITTAKLTSGGTNGSMTFASGILITQTAAT